MRFGMTSANVYSHILLIENVFVKLFKTYFCVFLCSFNKIYVIFLFLLFFMCESI